MGGNNKEIFLIETIRNGDVNAAIKFLTKNTSFKKSNKIKNSTPNKNKLINNGATDIVEASSSRNLIAKSKINVNYQNEHGITCLHQSCISGNIDIVRLLIECGSQIDIDDKNGLTALHYACQNAKYDIATILIRYGAECNRCTFNNDTPLHIAIQNNSLHNPIVNLNETGFLGEKLVYLLLSNGGYLSLAMFNKQRQTPFELACELGRTRIVDTILKFCLNNSEIILNNLNFTDINKEINEKILVKSNGLLLNDCPKLMHIIYLYSENSLHLSSRNGHDDIIRLLLQYNVVEINKLSDFYHGNALHEACRYGRYQTVKLLLECGIESNLTNQFNQKPIDVVIKQKIGNDIKQLIREFTQAVHAISIQSYLSNHVGSLNFELNEIITVLERPVTSTSWRGFILNQTNFTTRSGYFPSTHVKLIDMNDIQTSASNLMRINNIIYNKSNYGTVKSINGLAKPFITSSTISLLMNNSSSNEVSNSNIKFKFENEFVGNISITDTNTSIEKINSKSNNNPHLSNRCDSNFLLETKQNKDSIYISNIQLQKIQKQQVTNSLMSFSNQNNNNYSMGGFSPSSSSSTASSSNAMHSNTSSPSHKSISKLVINIGDLLRSGLNDSQIIFNWLSEMNLQQYYENFVQSGYDLITIMKTTPADLSAIGISDPLHRNLIKQKMKHLNIEELDNKLNYVLANVNSISDLLKLIHLEQYFDSITHIGNFKNLEEMLNTLTWEDLEEIGIRKLGHQKKLMLVVKKIKEISKLNSESKSPMKQRRTPSSIIITSPNWLAKSLENINDNLNLSCSTLKPVPPRRFDKCSQEFVMSSFNSDKSQSLLTSPQKTISSYATLPRNRKQMEQKELMKKTIENQLKSTNFCRPGTPHSQTSTSSDISPNSPSSSPNSISLNSSPISNERGDFDLPIPPPPMPLINIPISDNSKSRKVIQIPDSLNSKLLTPKDKQNSILTYSLTQSDSPVKNKPNLTINKNDLKVINDNSTVKSISILSTTANWLQPTLKINSSNDKNVLSDIDNMLCDLNKQLDDMLDCDKVFKS